MIDFTRFLLFLHGSEVSNKGFFLKIKTIPYINTETTMALNDGIEQ